MLEELRDTLIGVEGKRTRLLDEVDVVTSVSGGSFTAPYYGLFGGRIFEDFDERFGREGAELSTHLVEVAKHRIDDPADREFFDSVPTSLGLDAETVDRLVEIGRRVLRESEEFQELLAELGVSPAPATGGVGAR